MEQQWQSILRPRLNDQRLAAVVAAGLAKEIGTAQKDDQVEETIIERLEKFCLENARLSDEQVAQLRLVSDVYQATRGNVTLIKELLNADPKTASLSDVVYRYYCTRVRTSLSDNETRTLRIGLFEKEPTAVIAGLVQSGAISISNVEVQALVAKFFQTAVEQGFNISKQSISILSESMGEAASERLESKRTVFERVSAIQRLRAVVTDPLDLDVLMNRGFFSALSIASLEQDDFVQTTTSTSATGTPAIRESAAVAIWHQANMVNLRNERAWVDFIRQRAEIPVLAIDQADDTAPDGQATVSLETLFRDNDSLECDEHSSVLSPAAYLVDLLQLLRYSYVDPKAALNAENPSHLLTTFLNRRPDIAQLKLSKANTTTLVKYADLVNEVLESYLDSSTSGSPGDFVTYNEPDVDVPVQNLNASSSSKTNWKVYKDVIQRQVHPMKHFPFNLAHESSREYLTALGTSLYDLYRLFAPSTPPGDGFISQSPNRTQYQNSLLMSALKRRLAAEYLRLSHEDFVIITGEAFQSPAFVSELKAHRGVFSREEYDARIGLATTGEYWGYTSDDEGTADDKMVGKISSTHGLKYIKENLLPRSGLSFTELLAVLKTEFMAKRFVISLENARGAYSGKLEDMQLYSPSITEQALESYLLPQSCACLLSFIRLWKGLDWPINDVDAAVVTLGNARMSGAPISQNFLIDPETILDLAALKQLSDISCVELQCLLPLWSPMRTDGPDSLYMRLFCQSRLLRQYPELNVADAPEGAKRPKILQLMAPLLSVLKISAADFKPLAAAAGITEHDDWTPENVSSVYRYALLCSMLDVSPSQYTLWASLNAEVVDPFATPRSTLKVVGRWTNLRDKGWPTDLLFKIAEARNTRSQAEVGPDVINVTAKIIDVLAESEKKYSPITSPTMPDDAETVFSTKKVLELCSVFFDAATADKILSMVEGSLTTATTCPMGVAIPADSPLAKKVVVGGTSLKVYGILNDLERKSLTELAPTVQRWVSVVDKVYADALLPYQLLSLQGLSSTAEGSSYLLEPVRTPDAAKAEEERSTRRQWFMQSFVDRVKMKVTSTSIFSLIAAQFPNTDRRALSSLLDDTTDAGQSPLASLQSLSQTNQALLKNTSSIVQGYLIAPTTDEFTFKGEAGIDCMLTANGKSYHITADGTGPTQLLQAQCYSMQVSSGSNLQAIQYSTGSGGRFKLTPERFVHDSTVEYVASVLRRLSIASDVLSKVKLSENEFAHFKSANIDISKPSLRDLERLQAHAEVRELFKKGSKQPLIDFYKWCSEKAQTSATKGSLAEQISRTTGFELTQVEGLLSTWSEAAADLPAFDADRLLQLNEALNFAKEIQTPVKTLSDWTALNLPTETATAYEVAKSLESFVSTRSDAKSLKAYEVIAEKKRIALVQYLMTKRDIGDAKIVDEDSLFEYFLIDVQMGPQQQTSRIKQAISTIQLFVQRCLLGLEKKNGIPTTAVKRSSWAWMSKFTMWQANRKVFLYPENWVEGSLRDDKSETFRTAEAVILQSNLSLEKINSIVREYVYGVNEIADLQVQAYFWEAGIGFQGKYHLFARTRTAPYKYYYRILEVTGVKADVPKYNWYPWTKLDVEIPAQEVDWDGKNLPRAGTYLVPSVYRARLFLFIPQILLKSRPKRALPDVSFEQFAKKQTMKDSEHEPYWEIRMGWVENRNGKWSKKEVSVSGIEVQGYLIPEGNPLKIPVQATEMPLISSFHFRVSSRSPPDVTGKTLKSQNKEILVIDVTRWIKTGEKNYVQFHVGRFELRGTQMVVSDYRDTSNDWKHTVPTRFSRLDHTTSTTTVKGLKAELVPFSQYNPNITKDEQPLVALAPGLVEFRTNPTQDIIWTVSYNEAQYSGASALLVERTTASRVDSYFGIPPRTSDGLLPEGQREVVSVQRLSHDIAQSLMEVATRTNDLDSLFDVLESVPTSMSRDAFGGLGEMVARELASPYAIYNWELGFHLVLLLMERLLATQQFELALQLANLVFDPRADDEEKGAMDGLFIVPSRQADSNDLTTDQAKVKTNAKDSKSVSDSAKSDRQINPPGSKPLSSLDRCWKFTPFKNSKLRLAGSPRSVVEKLRPGPKTSDDIDDWLANPYNAHSIARGRPAIYMKRFIIKYIEILVAAGDAYFREDTLESIPLALQRYVEASQLFGRKPEVLPRPTKPIIKTYKDISGELNDFGNAAVDMELQFPFFVEPSSRAVLASKDTYDGILGMVRSSYFSVPANPQVAALRELIDDRFFKIRNSLDINGNFRRLALFEPPLDPGQLVRSMASGGMAAALAQSIDGPMPNYRFLYLLQKAFEICAELKSLDESYLSIKEKRDTEALAALRARQDTAMQTLALQMKQLQRDDALKTIEVLEATRNSHVMRLKYYLALTGESMDKVPSSGAQWQDIEQSIEQPTKDELVMSAQENMEMIKLDEADALGDIATAIENSCSVLMALPELETQIEPMGVGAAMQFDASKIAEGMMMVAGVIQQQAASRTSEASRASRKAQLIRQLQERRLQANQAGQDVTNVDRQIEGQRIKLAICDADIKMQHQQVANMTEVEEHLRTKYTSESLYAWMDASARQVLYQTYLLAIDAAKSAEKAFLFERGPAESADTYLSGSYWDGARDGAFAAQNLYLGLKRIENVYHKRKSHDFEMTKNISLRHIDPWALLRLQETGKTEFALPEVLFDYDFPGHYCRRIRSVAVTIPCTVGPYTSVCCTLRLLEHGYRLRQQQTGAPYYPTDGIDSDPRYRTNKIPISSVALSSSQQDAGVFELNFTSSERYGPFEGAGTVSRWSLELPPIATRQFDYRTVGDVILHVNYTSLDGGARWHKAASDAVLAFQRGVDARMHTALFDLRDAFLASSVTPASSSPPTAVLRDLPLQLPFWTRGKKIGFRQCWLVGTKGLGLLDGKSETKEMPTINLKATVDSRAKSTEGEQSVADEAMAALGELVDVVETDEDTSAGGWVWDDVTVQVKGLKVKGDGSTLREGRLWLLVRYSLS